MMRLSSRPLATVPSLSSFFVLYSPTRWMRWVFSGAVTYGSFPVLLRGEAPGLSVLFLGAVLCIGSFIAPTLTFLLFFALIGQLAAWLQFKKGSPLGTAMIGGQPS